MDVGRALTFVFHDPRWVGKLGIAMLLAVLPIAITVIPYLTVVDPMAPNGYPLTLLISLVAGISAAPLLGFGVRITAQVAGGGDLPLPDWSDAGALSAAGLKMYAVNFLWALPSQLVAYLGQSSAQSNATGPALAFNCLNCLLLFGIIILLPIATARLATTGSLVAGLDVGSISRVFRSNAGDYFVLLVLIFVGAFAFMAVAGIVWLALLAVGGPMDSLTAGVRRFFVAVAIVAVIFGPYGYFAAYHLYGQAYYRAMGGPVPPAARPRD